jgi:hypothetical protein
LAFRKRLSFCLRSFEKKPYLLPFTYTPDVRKKKFLFSDAWAIAEAYVGFCVGFTYTPDPAVIVEAHIFEKKRFVSFKY